MRKPELLSVGAWAPVDHMFFMTHYPEEGETISVKAERENYYYGDCSFNVAVVAGKLGINTGVASVVGEDFAEIGYESYLRRMGIDIERVVKVPGEQCGHNYLYFDEQGKGFCFSVLGASKMQDSFLMKKEEIEGIRHVVVSENFGEYTLRALRIAKMYGARTYINGMIGTAEPELLNEFLSLTDIIFINQSEYRRLLGKIAPSNLFTDYNVEKIFVTDGIKGSSVMTKKTVVREKAVPARHVKDTTGAGDSFAAGVIAGLIKGFDDRISMRIGAVVSSLIVEEWGCQTNAPDWEKMWNEYRRNYPEKGE